jgi:hypothetical protein
LCNLVAQSSRPAEGGLQAGGGRGTDGKGRGGEPSELIYFKVYKNQIPVIEQAIETAALMLSTDKSRGYCLEMICADFLAGAHLDNGNPEILRRDGWRCQFCGTLSNLEVHHREFRSHSGADFEENLITLCAACHSRVHRR